MLNSSSPVEAWEALLELKGIDRILEIPSKITLKWLKQVNPAIKLKFFSACCAIPKEFDDFTESKDSDIKGYLNI